MKACVSFGVVVSALVFAPAAMAQVRCPDGSKLTQASCGGDTCSCSSQCDTSQQCETGCCAFGPTADGGTQGYCALACVCVSGGTVNQNCGTGGCGSVAPASPVGGMGIPAGLALFAAGAIGVGRFSRSRRRSLAVLAAAVSLLGLGLVASTTFGTAPLSPAKSLKR